MGAPGVAPYSLPMPTPDSTHAVGRRYEGLAAAWLQARGWGILARNARGGHREIDLVARRRGVVAFVEVKARRSLAWGHPLEAITRRKRRDVEAAARRWMLEHRGDAALSGVRTWRFDVVGVVHEPGGLPRIEHLADAWRSGE